MALQWSPFAATMLLVLLWTGCGGSGSGGTPAPPQVGTPAGNYTITMSATAAGVTKTQNLALRVN